jgi:hypothetical protein
MIKGIISVIAGYIVMGVCVFTTFTVAYRILGAEGSFQPGTYDVSGIWTLISVVTALAASVLGGLVCISIAKSRRAVLGLVGLVIVLGTVSAVMETKKKASQALPPRTAEVSNQEAMMHARTPFWLLIMNPLLGVAGVLAGARLRKTANSA